MEENKVVYAGFWIRILAGILDLVFLIPLTIVLLLIVGIDFSQMQSNPNYAGADRGNALAYIISIAYITYFIAKKGQATPGKSILKIYVGNRDGSKLTWQKSLLRALGSMLTSITLGLGFLPVAFTKEKVSLHDWLCGTRAFRGKKS